MKKSERIKQLKSKLGKLRKIRAEKERDLLSEDGSVCIEKVIDAQRVVTDICITKRKLEFAQRNQPFLGNELGLKI
jgi:Mg2+/Co2+ transporter CorC